MRKNPLVRMGRPPKSAKAPGAFDPAIPAKAFRQGGAVHYDDSRMAKCHSEHGFASAVDHKRRLCGKEKC